MRYFDYPENKAAWEKELAELRKEKQRRAAGIQSEPENELSDEMISEKAAVREEKSRAVREPVDSFDFDEPVDSLGFDEPEFEAADSYRVRITYAELLMEEKMAIERKNMALSRSKEIQKEVAREL